MLKKETTSNQSARKMPFKVIKNHDGTKHAEDFVHGDRKTAYFIMAKSLLRIFLSEASGHVADESMKIIMNEDK